MTVPPGGAFDGTLSAFPGTGSPGTDPGATGTDPGAAGTVTAAGTAPAAGQVYRVQWVPGTDHLLGLCFCGAQHLEAEPIAVWEWLHAHPYGHDLLPAEPFPTQASEVPA